VKKTEAGNPGDWLFFATEDMNAVSLLYESKISFTVCKSKLAEAFEKSIKADLISRGWKLEKIHDLQKLCDLLAAFDSQKADNIQNTVDELSGSYTECRYPGFDLEEPDWSNLGKLISGVESYISSLGRLGCL
jgi:HEPN domain-containing protein